MPADRPSGSGDPAHRGGRVLSQNLIALGLTSFFTDVSSEMVLAVVPLFLTTSLGFTVFGFGLFEAAYQGTGAFFRIWGATFADHRQRHKQTAASGYGISALTRIGLAASALSSGVPAVPFLLVDRVGKGIRTAPRDALISLSTPPNRLGLAFGIHRSLDTAGALLGPLVAFAVLSTAPGRFDAVFVVSSIAGIVGLGVIVLFARERPQVWRSERRPTIFGRWREVVRTPGVLTLAAAAGLLSLFTVSDAFLYLVIQRSTNLSARYFPLLFVGTALTYLVLALPFGQLADRLGHARVFVGGHTLLVALYVLAARTDFGLASALACLGLLGAYYAATDGVLAAMASNLVAPEIRASGIALITVVVAAAKMISAGLFGLVWHSWGRSQGLVVYAVAVTLVVIISTVLLVRGRVTL